MTSVAETSVLAAAIFNPPQGAIGGNAAQQAVIAAEIAEWLEESGLAATRTVTFTDTGDLVRLTPADQTPVAVTLTDAGDVVGKVAHGYVAGDLVRFASIVTTTGLTAGQEYTVRTAGLTADAFTVSSSGGAAGSAVALTTNGTATVSKRTYPVHGYTTDDLVEFDDVLLTTGLTENVEYFVLASGLTTTDFKVSTTSGGSAATLTTDGTGTVAKRSYAQADAQTAVLASAQALGIKARTVKGLTDYAHQIAVKLAATA